MQISSRFTIAIHLLVCTEFFKETHKITSDFLSLSINVNSVTIRRIIQQLKTAKILSVTRGNIGSIKITKELKYISFYDIYEAVESTTKNKLFSFHKNPNPNCPIGKNIHNLLDSKLQTIQESLELEMKNKSLQDVFDEAKILLQS